MIPSMGQRHHMLFVAGSGEHQEVVACVNAAQEDEVSIYIGGELHDRHTGGRSEFY